MNGQRPTVVACMPAYEAANFIRPVLDSLIAQTYPNLKILISVDVCSDGTADLCEAFAAAQSNVTVIRQTTRQGWVGNSNVLLRAAEGEYLFFAFHDDSLTPEYVERLVDAIERNPRAVVAFSDMLSDVGVGAYKDLDGVADPYERLRRLMFVYGEWWVPFRGLMRTDAVRRIGGMRRLLAGEQHTDWMFLARLAALGEFVRVPGRLIHKVRRAGGVEASWKRDVRNAAATELARAAVIRGARLPAAQTARLYFMLLKGWLRAVLRRSGRARRRW